MIRVNRALLVNRLASGMPLTELTERAVGKTTGAILLALGESYRKPGEWVHVQDPDVKTTHTQSNLIKLVQEFARTLGLDHIEVRGDPSLGERTRPLPPYTPGVRAVYVRNTFAEVLS